jgi:hypothetical protein
MVPSAALGAGYGRWSTAKALSIDDFQGALGCSALSIIRRRLTTVGAVDRLPSTIDYRPSTSRLLL